MIETILPASVRSAQSFTDRLDISLFPQEQAVIERAVDKRRAEFTTVRALARDALAAIGQSPVPLLPDERGAPGWPAGVVGSMTHCAGYRAAAVARVSECIAVGIDAEPNGALPEGVLETISLPEERPLLAQLPDADGTSWDRLLFSAKESVYKVWYPLARRWLGFQDARVNFSPDGTFTALILVPAPRVHGEPLSILNGRWAADAEHVMTAITLERPAE
ncbi:4'-phosphopantetheinyl transferase superfamily protein [Streptomyces sp. NPDC048057]|uniref:4'-phosphopantetheinyl transferase family protein n=1 Tax=Streptomyces sp. NPDC048057 TaxID=3155628 RepID=UPI00340DA7C5